MALSFALTDFPLPVTAGVVLGLLIWLAYQFLTDSYFHHETHSAYGAAHWAKKAELKKASLFGSDGVILGRHHGKPCKVA